MTRRIRNELLYAVPGSSGRWLRVAAAGGGLDAGRACLQRWYGSCHPTDSMGQPAGAAKPRH